MNYTVELPKCKLRQFGQMTHSAKRPKTSAMSLAVYQLQSATPQCTSPLTTIGLFLLVSETPTRRPQAEQCRLRSLYRSLTKWYWNRNFRVAPPNTLLFWRNFRFWGRALIGLDILAGAVAKMIARSHLQSMPWLRIKSNNRQIGGFDLEDAQWHAMPQEL